MFSLQAGGPRRYDLAAREVLDHVLDLARARSQDRRLAADIWIAVQWYATCMLGLWMPPLIVPCSGCKGSVAVTGKYRVICRVAWLTMFMPQLLCIASSGYVTVIPEPYERAWCRLHVSDWARRWRGLIQAVKAGDINEKVCAAARVSTACGFRFICLGKVRRRAC